MKVKLIITIALLFTLVFISGKWLDNVKNQYYTATRNLNQEYDKLYNHNHPIEYHFYKTIETNDVKCDGYKVSYNYLRVVKVICLEGGFARERQID